MATYKPLATTVTSNAIFNANGATLKETLGATAWNLAFIYGTAIAKSIQIVGSAKVSATIVLSNAAVLGWYSNVAGSEGNAAIHGFAGTAGRYGITVNTGKPVTFKFYAHG